MAEKNFIDLVNKTSALAVFRGVLEDEVFAALKELLFIAAVEQESSYDSIESDVADTFNFDDDPPKDQPQLSLVGADEPPQETISEEEALSLLDEMINFYKENAPAYVTAADESSMIYGEFVSALYENGANLSEHLLKIVLEDENVYVKAKAKEEKIPKQVEETAKNELRLFGELATLKASDFYGIPSLASPLPEWKTSKIDFVKKFKENLKEISKKGYGIYAKYHAFMIKGDDPEDCIVPVKHPDDQQLDHLYGYERERKQIIANTEALLYKGGCNNMLLYGDAGTGKSSTIKAVAARYASEGLRIIELKKNQLFMIPDIIDSISDIPLKFILFIDDLSFSKNDDNFSALKAILEGSITSAGDNVAVYATSNRRHLVKESMADREGDDLHVNDTLQETASLSARFGLTITFQRPEKDEYLKIVENLAIRNGLDIDKDDLFKKAEAHAIRVNGRTPRAAKQFIMSQKIGL